jgi:single-stranded DNA-binding protein
MTQVFHNSFAGLVRIIAKRENSIRYTAEAGSTGSAVLNCTVVKYLSGGDDESPVFIDLALWGKLAERYRGCLEDGQLAWISVNDLQIYLDSYEKDGEEIYSMKGKTSVNNGYQFTLFPETVKGNTDSDYSAGSKEDEAPQARSIRGNKAAASTKKSKDDGIPF